MPRRPSRSFSHFAFRISNWVGGGEILLPSPHAQRTEPVSRAFLICPEPVRQLTAGVGTRFVSVARVLADAGHRVTLAVAVIRTERAHFDKHSRIAQRGRAATKHELPLGLHQAAPVGR